MAKVILYSLDRLIEMGMQFKLPSSDENKIIENIENAKLYEKALAIIREFDEPDQQIWFLFCDGVSMRKIAILTNRNPMFISRTIKRLKSKLLFSLKNVTHGL